MLLQALFHCQVPLSRAAWLIRIICPQWVKKATVAIGPPSSSVFPQASGAPDSHDRPKAPECNLLWTRHVLEALDVQLEAHVSAEAEGVGAQYHP